LSEGSFHEKLAPANLRSVKSVREHEILRISAVIGGGNFGEAADSARQEIMAWAQNRSGGVLPAEAWRFENFDFFSGGRNSAGIRISNPQVDLWALRADDPDKNIAGRVWTTEVVVGSNSKERARFSARLLVSTAEQELAIVPHSPGFVRQIVEKCGLYQGQYDLELEPILVADISDAQRLLDLLMARDRDLPVFVLTVGDGETDTYRPLIDAKLLAQAVLGLAYVAIVPAEFTWFLSEKLGRLHSVFGGAVRSYLPGFNSGSNPFDHRLFLAEQLFSDDGNSKCVRWLRQIAADESVRNRRLGKDVLAFAAIRNSSLRSQQQLLTDLGASDSEKLAAAEARIVALENDLREEIAAQEFFDSETKKAEERATASEAQYRASVYRIQDLQERIRTNTGGLQDNEVLPQSWEEFANWCDVQLAGQVAITPLVRRQIKNPEFLDVAAAARCLKWLGDDYRKGRIDGSTTDYRDYSIEPGLWNSPCGGDEFEFDWQGRRHTADWHIKSGGNTRDPTRCLRIYFAWEPETQQVVIAHMPAHRDTDLS
jgi:hypothetical protein